MPSLSLSLADRAGKQSAMPTLSFQCGPCRQKKRDAHTFVPVSYTKPGVCKKSNFIPDNKITLFAGPGPVQPTGTNVWLRGLHVHTVRKRERERVRYTNLERESCACIIDFTKHAHASKHKHSKERRHFYLCIVPGLLRFVCVRHNTMVRLSGNSKCLLAACGRLAESGVF